IDLQFHLFEAVDKHSHYFKKDLGYSSLIQHSYSLQTLYKNAWFKGFDGREMFPEELGCYASHYLLWLKCIENNKPIVILEDDFDLQSNFRQSIVDCLKNPFDFVRLYGDFHEKRPKYSEIGALNGTCLAPLNPKVLETILATHFYFSVLPVLTTLAYYITPKAAKAFVSASHHFSAPVDVFMNQYWVHHIPNFTYIPLSVHPTDEHKTNSTILTATNKHLMGTQAPYKGRKKTGIGARIFEKCRKIYYYHHFLRQYARLQ
ncbi:glycosyltransferase family 25 protein, partial [Helicobacter baculiformis]